MWRRILAASLLPMRVVGALALIGGMVWFLCTAGGQDSWVTALLARRDAAETCDPSRSAVASGENPPEEASAPVISSSAAPVSDIPSPQRTSKTVAMEPFTSWEQPAFSYPSPTTDCEPVEDPVLEKPPVEPVEDPEDPDYAQPPPPPPPPGEVTCGPPPDAP